MMEFTTKFSLKQTSKIRSDESASYDVILKHKMTLSEFIDAVLENTREWGHIGLEFKGTIFGSPCCDYRYGELTDEGKETFTETQLNSIVKYVKADGGWTNMNYLITLE